MEMEEKEEREKDMEEKEEEKCLPQCQRYLREDILSSKRVLFLLFRSVSLQQSDSGMQSEHLCMGLWGGLSACPHRRGPTAHRGGRTFSPSNTSHHSSSLFLCSLHLLCSPTTLS